MSESLALDLPGSPRVALGDAMALPARKALALLAYLALAGAAPRARLARQHEKDGDIGGALRLIRLLLDDDPLQEACHREATRLLGLQGDRGAALAQYERLRTLLRTELALDPLAAEVLALVRALSGSTGARVLAPTRGHRRQSDRLQRRQDRAVLEPPCAGMSRAHGPAKTRSESNAMQTRRQTELRIDLRVQNGVWREAVKREGDRWQFCGIADLIRYLEAPAAETERPMRALR